MIFNVSCYIIIQLATILIIHETKRVKLILTAQNSLEYVDRNKNLQLEKKVLIGAFLVSLAISYARYTLIYQSFEVNYESFTSFFAFMIYIDVICNLIAQSIILYSFYISFRFFRDQYVESAGLEAVPCKLKFLTGWIVFLIL